MPTYEVHFTASLEDHHKDAIAEAITDIHAEKFMTPRLFVNVQFINRNIEAASRTIYKGGKRRTGNDIIANVRAGASRSRDDFVDLCKRIERAWYSILQDKGSNESEVNLRSVIVRGVILTGIEAGFVRPLPGEDVAWLRENWEAFEKKANGGDVEFQELVEEVRGRGLLDSSN